MKLLRALCPALLGLLPVFGPTISNAADATAIHAQDDRGRTVDLAAPARRAVTLAPHATELVYACLLYTSPSPRDVEESRMPSSA